MKGVIMKRKIITLRTEKELKVFMDPLRQRLLRTMEIAGTPLTAKNIADRMKMTAPSAKHHLTQLESIGLVEPDHTEIIHGITAQYYQIADVEIRMGVDESEFQTEKDLIAENLVMSVFRDFIHNLHTTSDLAAIGDIHTGVVHLTEEQYHDIHEQIIHFSEENRKSSPNKTPYEFAVLYTKGSLS